MNFIKSIFEKLTIELSDLSLSAILSGVVTVIVAGIRIISYLPATLDSLRAIERISSGTSVLSQLGQKFKSIFNRRKS